MYNSFYYSIFVLFLNVIYNPQLLKKEWIVFFNFLFDPILKYSVVPFLNWHLWFIPIYIIFIPFIPIIYFYCYKNIKKDEYKNLILVIFALFLFFLDFLEWHKISIKGNYYIRNILMYGFYIYLGFEYKKKKITKKDCFINIFYTLFLILNLKKFYVFNMQINKFPPKFLFLLFTFAWFNILQIFNSVLLNIYNRINVLKKIVDFYSEKNFILYLWHPIVYLGIYFIMKKFNIVIENSILKIFLIFSIVILNMINGILFDWTEKLYIKLLKK